MAMSATARKSTAREVRDLVLSSRDRIWRADEFTGPGSAVSCELRRLASAGELRRIRRGLYWRGHATRFGMSTPDEGAALRSVLPAGEAIGATGWHAANLLGLSTQVSPVEALAVTRRPPAGFKRLKLVDRSGRTGRRTANLSGLEVTVLEALEGWEAHVELPARDAQRRFVELLSRDDVRIDALVSASSTEPPAVRERLRAVLIASGHEGEAARVARARGESSRRRALGPVGLKAP